MKTFIDQDIESYVSNLVILTWPDKDDEAWQPASDILGKALTDPEILPGRGLHFRFAT